MNKAKEHEESLMLQIEEHKKVDPDSSPKSKNALVVTGEALSIALCDTNSKFADDL